jgi:NADH dehydrogenase FAD-containing subunit
LISKRFEVLSGAERTSLSRAQNVADDPKSILARVGDQRHGIFGITEAATCRSPWLSVENCHGAGRRHCEQMKSDMQDVEVENQILIAGAGPSGLALAAELSRRGVSAAIIDRQTAGANTSRACVVHARTM